MCFGDLFKEGMKKCSAVFNLSQTSVQISSMFLKDSSIFYKNAIFPKSRDDV